MKTFICQDRLGTTTKTEKETAVRTMEPDDERLMAGGREVVSVWSGPVLSRADLGAVDVRRVGVVHGNVHVADRRLIRGPVTAAASRWRRGGRDYVSDDAHDGVTGSVRLAKLRVGVRGLRLQARENRLGVAALDDDVHGGGADTVDEDRVGVDVKGIR